MRLCHGLCGVRRGGLGGLGGLGLRDSLDRLGVARGLDGLRSGQFTVGWGIRVLRDGLRHLCDHGLLDRAFGRRPGHRLRVLRYDGLGHRHLTVLRALGALRTHRDLRGVDRKALRGGLDRLGLTRVPGPLPGSVGGGVTLRLMRDRRRRPRLPRNGGSMLGRRLRRTVRLVLRHRRLRLGDLRGSGPRLGGDARHNRLRGPD
ncbi:hypothetical protein, partial [Streptomyces nigra]